VCRHRLGIDNRCYRVGGIVKAVDEFIGQHKKTANTKPIDHHKPKPLNISNIKNEPVYELRRIMPEGW
jgi:hypothetical protein